MVGYMVGRFFYSEEKETQVNREMEIDFNVLLVKIPTHQRDLIVNIADPNKPSI